MTLDVIYTIYCDGEITPGRACIFHISAHSQREAEDQARARHWFLSVDGKRHFCETHRPDPREPWMP